MLHRMSSLDVIEQGHSPEFLDKALSYLKNKGYNFISLEQIFDAAEGKIELPKKSIAFTMDDGFEDQVEIAAPIFIKHQCPATIFLITNFIDTGNPPWDSLVKHVFINSGKKEISLNIEGKESHYNLGNIDESYKSLREFRDKCKEFSHDSLNGIIIELLVAADMEVITLPLRSARPLTWKRAQELEGQGISFAPHTENHTILSRVSDDVARKEITGAWERLKKEFKRPCPVYAYPTGRKQDFSSRDIKIIENLGISGAVTAESGYIDFSLVTNADRYLVKRMSFPENFEELIQRVSGLEFMGNELTALKDNFKYRGNRYMLSLFITQLKSSLGFYDRYQQLDWGEVTRLVFVCKGNICRSPYAEMKVRSLGLDAISVGLSTIEGSPANANAIESASYRSIKLDDHRARLANSINITKSDLVICMEPLQLKQFSEINSIDCQLTLLGLFASRKKPVILDPYGRPGSYFDDCFQQIDFALHNLLAKWRCPKIKN